MPTPIATATAVGNVIKSTPNTRTISVVSVAKQGLPTSVYDKILSYGKLARDTTVSIFGPSDFSVPGSAPVARALARGVANVTDAAASGVTNAVSSATAGIQSGFKMGTLILVLVVGVWVWSVVRPR